MTETIRRNRNEGCSIGRHLIPYGIATCPLFALVPLLLSWGCACVSSLPRACRASVNLPRVLNHERSCRAIVALVFDKLHCFYILIRRRNSLRLRCFELAKKARLAIQPSPGLTLLDVLGKSALTGAYILPQLLRPAPSFAAIFHAVSANRLISFCFSRLLALAFDQRPTATCQLRGEPALPLPLRLREPTA